MCNHHILIYLIPEYIFVIYLNYFYFFPVDSTTVRKTRSGGLAGTDGSVTQRSQLGSADADFEFSQLGSGRVQVRECSARGNAAAGDQPEIEEVSEWLQSLK